MARSTLSSAEARARAFPSPERERGSKASRASCSNLFELYVRSCRDALSGRTSRERSRARTGRLSDACSGRWMRSGTVWHGEFWTRNSSAWPSDASVSFLSECLEAPPVPARYYLSPTACAGIIRRARRRGRSLPPQLEEALEPYPYMMTPCQIAEFTGLTSQGVRKLLAAGEMRGVKFGSKWLVPKLCLLRYLNRREDGGENDEDAQMRQARGSR